MKEITMEMIQDETLWKLSLKDGTTKIGTVKELSEVWDAENYEDIDKLCDDDQPETLRDFYKSYHAYCEAEGHITVTQYLNGAWKKAQMPKRVWTAEEIADLIQTNDTVLYRALKKLYAEQTRDEQMSGETTHRNGIGFNGVDSRFLSSVAEFLNRTGSLTAKQKVVTRRMLKKYNKQLTRLANA